MGWILNYDEIQHKILGIKGSPLKRCPNPPITLTLPTKQTAWLTKLIKEIPGVKFEIIPFGKKKF